MKPPCFNRAPRAPTYNANAGYDSEGRLLTKEIPIAFVDRCAVWDGKGIGPNGESYPIAHGWTCLGCRWLPAL